VPICAELLQAFKAKAAAEKEHKEAEQDIDVKVKLFMSNSKNQLKLKINSVLDALNSADVNNTGRLPRSTLVKLLRANHNLEKSEANMVRAPHAEPNRVACPANKPDSLFHRRCSTLCSRTWTPTA
jgi:hypothetical protein